MYNYTFPAGVYYLGDPCYALAEDTYDMVWGAQHGFSTGKLTTPTGSFVVDDTENGDGIYYGNDGRKYAVDSGTIALIPWSMCVQFDSYESANAFGRVLSSVTPVMWSSNGGIFKVMTGVGSNVNIEIDTGADDDSLQSHSDQFSGDESE